MIKTRLLITIILCINIGQIKAQQGFSITGNDCKNFSGSFCYTIGSFSYQNNNNSALSVTEGLQQPLEIQTELNFKDAKPEVDLYCRIFPNPATRYVNLVIDNFVVKDVYFILTDLGGNTKRSGLIIGNKTSFGVEDLSKGIYLLKISSRNSKIKTYKILIN